MFNFIKKIFKKKEKFQIIEPEKTFVSNKPVTKIQKLIDISGKLKIETELLSAFLSVESGGRNYDKDGRLIIRFEKHIFKRYSKLYKEADWQDVKHGNQGYEYDSFEKAIEIDTDAAFNSISMGSAQIMGFNCKRCGYDWAGEMFTAFEKSALNTIDAFANFIGTDNKLLEACRKKDYHQMASRYNGKSYKKYVDSRGRNYADKIEETYNKLKANRGA